MLAEVRGKRPVEDSPPAGNLTEGLTTNFFDLEDAPAPAAADVNPLGGRPLGTTVAASRVVKKVTSLIHVIL